MTIITPARALVVLSLSLLAGLLPAQEAAAPPVKLEIESLPLSEALKQLADQADQQIVFLPSAVADRIAPEIKGELTPEQALEKLLAGTPLEFVRTKEGVFIVRERSVASAGKPEEMPATPTEEGAKPPRSRSKEPTPKELVAEMQQPASLGDIMVTGTHLRVAPVGAQVITIDREDFERMGVSTVHDVVRRLPQNFGGGATEDTITGLEAPTNTAEGNSPNLRGLGSSSTLVLLNGRRLAASGSEGAFTDVSNIPLTAVERIDVLPDGASAFYGSDAVGGVVNIVLRADYVGAESQARVGTIPDGYVDEFQAGQVFGGHWKGGSALVAAEYYQRDGLQTNDRVQARSDLRPFGGTNFDTRNGNPGTIVIGAQTWAIPAGQDGTQLTPADFVAGTQNLYDRREGTDLLPRRERVGLVAALHQQVNDKVDLFLDALLSRREFDSISVGVPATFLVPASNAFYVNPTGGSGPIVIAYNFVEDLGKVRAFGSVDVVNAALGAFAAVGGDWRITAYGAYATEQQEQRQHNLLNFGALTQALADSNPATAFNPFGDGSHTNPATLATLRTSSLLRARTKLRSAHLVADGPLFDLGAGDVKLALGADHRRPSLDSSNASQVTGVFTDIRHSSQRSVSAVFGELLVPLFSEQRRVAGIERLDLSIAGRYEKYNDFGDTAVPAFGLIWEPLPGFAVRGTWSRSFKAPSLADMDESQNFLQIAPLRDTASPAGFTSTLVWFGKNADLDEETARSWTAGLEFAPPSLPGLSVGLTYFDIAFNDRIQTSSFNFQDLADPRQVAFVNRSPTAEDRARACSRGNFFGNPADCTTAPIGVLLDVRLQNIAISRTSGVDLLGTYDFQVDPLGRFEVTASGTCLFEFSQATMSSSPVMDLVDTQNNPIDLHLRGGLTWLRSGLEASLFVNYADAYRDVVSVPNRRVDSWTTYDVQLAYTTPASDRGFFGDVRISLSAENVLDDNPPFLNSTAGLGYDTENADLLGRVLRFHVRKNW